MTAVERIQCPEKTRAGKRCSRIAGQTADPDGIFRCSAHSTSPDALNVKKRQARLGAEAEKKRNRAEGRVLSLVEGDKPDGIDFSTPEAIAKSCGVVADRVLRGFSENPAACGQAIAKLAAEARAALREHRESGGGEEKDQGVIRAFKFQLAARRDGTDG